MLCACVIICTTNICTCVGVAFINNPYDNQRRVSLMCNAILDTRVYNGHTTAGDALWGG